MEDKKEITKKYERVNAQEAMIDVNDPKIMENVQRNLKILNDELAKKAKEIENEEIDFSGFESTALRGAMIDPDDPRIMKDENNIPSNRKDARIDPQKVKEQSIYGIEITPIGSFEGVDFSGLEFEAHKVYGDFEEMKECDNEAPKRRR